MTETKVQAVPQVLSSPWRPGVALTAEEAGCTAAALQPVTREELAGYGFGDALVDGLLARGILAEGWGEAGLWHGYGWGRPQEFVEAAAEHRARTAGQRPLRSGLVTGVLDGPEAVGRTLARRSVRRFSREPLPRRVLEAVLAPAGVLLRQLPHLRLYVAVQEVEATERGVYAYRSDGSLMLLRNRLEDRTMMAVSHQYWALGTGAVMFIGVCWQDLAEVHGGGPDAYLTLLTECGRVGHAAVLAAAVHGAGTWMTPALDEQKAAEMCGLIDADGTGGDLLYMVKIGMPRTTEDDQ